MSLPLCAAHADPPPPPPPAATADDEDEARRPCLCSSHPLDLGVGCLHSPGASFAPLPLSPWALLRLCDVPRADPREPVPRGGEGGAVLSLGVLTFAGVVVMVWAVGAVQAVWVEVVAIPPDPARRQHPTRSVSRAAQVQPWGKPCGPGRRGAPNPRVEPRTPRTSADGQRDGTCGPGQHT